MSADVVAVLVVPAVGDPGRLLEKGSASHFAPAEVPRCGCGSWVWHGCARLMTEPWHFALPLWWEEKLCPEGWDRARRRLLTPGGENHGLGMAAWAMLPEVGGVRTLADKLVEVGLASRVVRLARVDGRLVELEPVGVGS